MEAISATLLNKASKIYITNLDFYNLGNVCEYTNYDTGGYFTIPAASIENLLGFSNYVALNYFWTNFNNSSVDLLNPIPAGTITTHKLWVRSATHAWYSTGLTNIRFPLTYLVGMVYQLI